MKKIAIMTSFILSLSIVVFAASFSFFDNDKVVVNMDDKAITKATLKQYVSDLELGKQYTDMLGTKDGLKRLADFYITRTLLLDFAANNDYKDSSFVKQHTMDKTQDVNTIMISAVLKKEVNDKINVEMNEIDDYLVSSKTTDRKAAYFKLQSIKRQKIYKDFIAELKSKHQIEYID